MGMESPELLAAHHQAQQQQQRQLLVENSGSMLSPTAQPTGGGSMQPLQQGQQDQIEGQDPLQSLVQQYVLIKRIEYFLTQGGHV